MLLLLGMALLLTATSVGAQAVKVMEVIPTADVSPFVGPVIPYSPTDNPWDILWFSDVEAACLDNQLLGAEFAANKWFVSGGNTGVNPNKLYILDYDGTLLNTIDQPTTSSWGWRDLTYDGTYLYAGDEGNLIHAFDTDGNLVPSMNIPRPTGITCARALTYDPATDHFYSSNWGPLTLEFTRTGLVVRTFNCLAPSTYGLAWDATATGGPFLWAFAQTGPTTNYRTTIFKVNPTTGDTLERHQLQILAPDTAQIAGGLGMTNQYNPAFWTLFGITQGTPHDMLFVLELYNTGPSECVPISNSDTLFIPYEVLYSSEVETLEVAMPDTVITCWITQSGDTIWDDTPDETIVGATVSISPTYYIGNYTEGFYHTHPTMTVYDEGGLFLQATLVDYGPEMGDFEFVPPEPGDTVNIEFDQLIFFEDLIVNKSRVSEYIDFLSPLGGSDPDYIDSLANLPGALFLPHGGFLLTEVAGVETTKTEYKGGDNITVVCTDTAVTIIKKEETGNKGKVTLRIPCYPSPACTVVVDFEKVGPIDKDKIQALLDWLGAQIRWIINLRNKIKLLQKAAILLFPDPGLGRSSLDEERIRPPGVINLFETQSDIDWAATFFPLDSEESFTLMTGPEAFIGSSAGDLGVTSTASLRYERWGENAFAGVFALYAGQPGTQLQFDPDISGGERVVLDVRNAGNYPVDVQITGHTPGGTAFSPGDQIYLRPTESGTLRFWIEDSELEGADLTDMRLFFVTIGTSPGVDSVKVDFDNFGVVGLVAPSPVSDLVISASGTNVILTWSSVPFGLNYKVYESSVSPQGPWSLLATTSDTTYTHGGAISSYPKLFYYVTANNP